MINLSSRELLNEIYLIEFNYLIIVSLDNTRPHLYVVINQYVGRMLLTFYYV